MPVINVPGVGAVSFPDTMSQDDIINAIERDILPAQQQTNPIKRNAGTLGDLGTAVKQGVASIPGSIAGLADIPIELVTGKNVIGPLGDKLAAATGIDPSEYIKKLEQEKSTAYQARQEEANALWEARERGEASLADIAKFYAANPALTATNIAESAPSMVLGGAYGRALKGVSALSGVARGAIGEGAVSAGQINQQLGESNEGSRKQAVASILGGAGTSAVAGVSGKLAQRLGIIDPETFLAGKTGALSNVELAAFENAAKQGIVKRFGLGAVQEGLLEELPQSVLEQMTQNWGSGRPIMEGVERQAIEGALAGSVLGGGFNVLGGNPAAEQLRARDEQQRREAYEATARAQRQATGVMEQQPLFTPEEAPIPELVAETEAEVLPEPTLTIPEPEVEPEQIALFGPRGGVTPEAKASVALAREQGLPAEIDTLLQTPEGRKQLAGDMKTYFPELSTQERNKTRKEIQQGTYGVTPAPVVEGTLTPDLLKQFEITPRDRDFYKALEGANLADPMTYRLLAQAAESGTNKGIKANRILEAYPQYNPETAQRDLFGGPANEPRTEPEQPDLFGVQADGLRTEAEPAGIERSVEQPVLRDSTEPTAVAEPDGRGLGYAGEPASGGNAPLEAVQETQPSALTPEETRIKVAGTLLDEAYEDYVNIIRDDNATAEQVKAVEAALEKAKAGYNKATYIEPTPTLTPAEVRAQERAARVAVKAKEKEAKAAVAKLKAEPIEDAWSDFMTGIDYPNLSDIAKERVLDAHKANLLTQSLADEIAGIDKRNKRAEAANAAVAPKEELSLTEEAAALPTIEELQPSAETQKIADGISNKSMVQVAQWVGNNAPSKSYRIIARQVATKLAQYEKAGIRLGFYVTKRGGRGNEKPLATGTQGSTTHSAKKLSGGQVDIVIQGAEIRGSGVNYETILHELVHAAIDAAIIIHDKSSTSVAGVSPFVKRLEVIYDNLTAAAKKALVDPNTSTQQKEFLIDALRGNNNAFANTFELVTWGMTNPDMQQFLESIKLPKTGKTLWSEFVSVVRNLLSIPATANTALSEVLSVSEALINVPTTQIRQELQAQDINFQTSNQIDQRAQLEAEQLIKGMSGTIIDAPKGPTRSSSEVVQNIVQDAIKNPSGAFKMIEGGIAKVRTTLADKGAYVATQIQDFNDGAFYGTNGTIRADMLLSAEANTGNYIDAFFNFGGIDILPNGAVQVTDSDTSVDNIYRAAKQLADRIGVDTAKELITKAFYHYRAAAIKAMPKDQWPENWQQDPRMVPTQQQIQAGINAFNQVPELQEMRKQFIGSKNNIVAFLNKAGFLTDAKTKEYLADDSYAPWMRIKEYQDKAPGMGNIGRMVDLSQMKKLVGGTEEVNDMLENMAQMLAWGVRSGIKNHTANSALSIMEQMGTAVKSAGRPGNVDPNHLVMTYEAGKPVFWRVDNPYDLAAFQSVKALNSGFMKVMAKWMGTLRAGIVLFPVFPVRQVIMDSQRAYMQAGVDKPLAMVGKIFKAFLSGEAYKEISADAATLQKFGVAAQVDYSTYDASRGMAQKYGLNEREKGITNWWVNTPAYQALHKFAYSADLAVRLGIYRQTLEETGDKTLAATRAREIINFQKSGTSELVITLKQTIPFLGAYLQGMDVNYRSMTGRGNSMKQRKAAAAAYWGNLAMYAGLVIAYTMANSGDDEYEEQKGFITDRNFLIPGGLLLPVPPDVGFLAKVLPERITDYIMQEGTADPESAKRLRQGILEAAMTGYTPPASVYGVTPAIELATNTSFFSNMPIVGEYYKNLKPSEQYTPRTSEFAKLVGDAANVSPLQLDHIFNAIGGTSAGALMQLADVMLGSEKTAAEKLPVIGTFQQKKVGGRYLEEYYAVREMTTEAYNTAKAMAERGETDKLEAYVAQPEVAARLGARAGVEQVHTLLNQASNAKNAIDSDKSLSPEERRAQIDSLYSQIETALRDMGIRDIRSKLE